MTKPMTSDDLARIQKIINQMQCRPTMKDLHKRTAAAGMPFALVTLRRKPQIKSMIDAKQQQYKKKHSSGQSPRAAKRALSELDEANKTIAGLKAENERLCDELNQANQRAVDLNIPERSLGRPKSKANS